MKKFIFLLLIILFISGFIFVKQYTSSSHQVIGFSEKLYLIVEDQEVECNNPVIFYGDILYLSFESIKQFVDSNIFYDNIEKTVIITDEKKVKKYRINDNTGSVNNKEFLLTNPIKEVNAMIYIPIDLILQDYDISINYFEETNAVVLDYNDVYYLNGEVILDNAVIRTNLDIKSPIIENGLPIETIVNVYGEYESWYKVRTMDGISGFMEKRFLKLNHTKDIYKVEIPKDEKGSDYKDEKINLTWDYTYRKVKNTDDISYIPGVNVISPTWFSITDNEGSILDKGNPEYVNKYNQLGYQIWPLIDNDFDPNLTHELLSSSNMRGKLIQDIFNIYSEYGFQGINIDFENVHLKTKDLLTQFIRELYPIFNEAGMSVSMDVTGMSTSENWSLSYDRKRLSQSVDYMMLMAYDQHWASSPIAGSVAEYTWVERSIKGVLDSISNEKMILSVPFYTRLWLEKDGKISSQALSMETANKFISENNINLTWDEVAAQYYGEIFKDDTLYKIWLEDGKSLEIKASLIHKYDLAGIASWRKGFETEDIWHSMGKVFN